jgi:AbrB family looped-hinge helix DNA binding protein
MKNSTNNDTVSFTRKGQIVIPRRIRREFEIEEGTQAVVQTTSKGILLKPITGKHIRSLRGKYKHLDLMKALTQSRKEDRHRDW